MLDSITFFSWLGVALVTYRGVSNKIFFKMLGSTDGETWVHSDGKNYSYPQKEIIHRFSLSSDDNKYILKTRWNLFSCFVGGFVSLSFAVSYLYFWFNKF